MNYRKAVSLLACLIAAVLGLTSCVGSSSDEPPADESVTVFEWTDVPDADQETKIVLGRTRALIEEESGSFRACDLQPGAVVTSQAVSPTPRRLTEDVSDGRIVRVDVTFSSAIDTGHAEPSASIDPNAPRPAPAIKCDQREKESVLIGVNGFIRLTNLTEYEQYNIMNVTAREVPLTDPTKYMVDSDGITLPKATDRTDDLRPIEHCDLNEGDTLMSVSRSKSGDFLLAEAGGCNGDDHNKWVDVLISAGEYEKFKDAYHKLLKAAKRNDTPNVQTQLVSEQEVVFTDMRPDAKQCVLQVGGVVKLLDVRTAFQVIRYSAPPRAATAQACPDDLLTIAHNFGRKPITE